MKFWVSICFWITAIYAVGQQVDSIPLVQVAAGGQIVEADNVGHIYVVNAGTVVKYDLSGKELQKNSALAWGRIGNLDATNALKIQLFFDELSQIVYLDNLLAERGDALSLELNGYVQTTAVCRSYNDGFWLYDNTTFELKRLTEQFEVTAQSGNLSQIIGAVPEFTYIREARNLLYANDPQLGILVFDWYGSYVKTLPFSGQRKFVIFGNTLYYLKEKKLLLYDLQNGDYSEIGLTDHAIQDFTIFENTLVILTQNQLQFFRLRFN